VTHFIKQTPHILDDSREEECSSINHIYHFWLGGSNLFLYTSAAPILGTVSIEKQQLTALTNAATYLPTSNCLKFFVH